RITVSATKTGASAAAGLARAGLCVILLITDLLHPVDGLPVELLLNRDVCHGGGRRGAMPVLLARREPDHVTRPNFFDRAPPSLRAPAPSRHDQRLAQRVGVPCGARAGL